MDGNTVPHGKGAKVKRQDMLVELVTDQINLIEQMIRDGDYQDVHTWLHPILLRELKLDYAEWTDAELENYYNDQLGVDTPSSPPLSSDDAQEKDQIYSQAEESERRSMPGLSSMDPASLSLLHPLGHAQSVGKMATKSPVSPNSQAAIHWY